MTEEEAIEIIRAGQECARRLGDRFVVEEMRLEMLGFSAEQIGRILNQTTLRGGKGKS